MPLALDGPLARVTAVGVDLKSCAFTIGVHLVDYVLEGNHAVFEHPVPGELVSVTAVVQTDVLPTFCIFPGSL